MVMTRVRTSVIVAVFALAGCGGSDKKVEEPVEEVEVEPEPESEGDVLISQQKLDEVRSFFQRRARNVSRCWGEAIEAGEVKRSERGAVAVWLTIRADGSPTDVRVTEATPKSAMLEGCVLDKVRGWKLPTLPHDMEFAYQFAFEEL
jgi:hypothetical protein